MIEFDKGYFRNNFKCLQTFPSDSISLTLFRLLFHVSDHMDFKQKKLLVWRLESSPYRPCITFGNRQSDGNEYFGLNNVYVTFPGKCKRSFFSIS